MSQTLQNDLYVVCTEGHVHYCLVVVLATNIRVCRHTDQELHSSYILEFGSVVECRIAHSIKNIDLIFCKIKYFCCFKTQKTVLCCTCQHLCEHVPSTFSLLNDYSYFPFALLSICEEASHFQAAYTIRYQVSVSFFQLSTVWS